MYVLVGGGGRRPPVDSRLNHTVSHALLVLPDLANGDRRCRSSRPLLLLRGATTKAAAAPGGRGGSSSSRAVVRSMVGPLPSVCARVCMRVGRRERLKQIMCVSVADDHIFFRARPIQMPPCAATRGHPLLAAAAPPLNHRILAIIESNRGVPRPVRCGPQLLGPSRRFQISTP